MTDWRTILRPVWGFIVLQPIMLGWFYLFSDDWVADYQALGWPLQVTCVFCVKTNADTSPNA